MAASPLPGAPFLSLELIFILGLFLTLTLEQKSSAFIFPNSVVAGSWLLPWTPFTYTFTVIYQVSGTVLCAVGVQKSIRQSPYAQGPHLQRLRQRTTYTPTQRHHSCKNNKAHFLSTSYMPGTC